MKMICRMLPSTNGSTTLVGTMWTRNSHHFWDSPVWISWLTESDGWMALASALMPSPSGNRLIARSPNVIATRVPTWK